jgi:GGDEF domain-containing protein
MAQVLGLNLAQEQSQYDALFDPLTGLPGWALLRDRTSVALARARRTNRSVAVFVLDRVHAVGGHHLDLIAFAHALQSTIRLDDTAARVGAATFVVVTNEIGEDRDVARIARRVVAELGVTCRLGCALGEAGDRAEQLLTRAIELAAN